MFDCVLFSSGSRWLVVFAQMRRAVEAGIQM